MKHLLLVIIVFCGCNGNSYKTNDHIPKKPFYIVGKSTDIITSTYWVVDSTGYKFCFSDDRNRYLIGDSIK